MKRQLVLILALGATLSVAGCAAQSQGTSAAAPSGQAAAAPQAAAGDNALSKVTVGMTKGQVRQAVGQPSDENSYATGKAWIPFYFGTDARRTSWYYKGQGRVVFADGNVFGGGTPSVVRVDIDPTESGIAR